MEISDFEYNEGNFEMDLRKAEIGFRRAKEYFFERVDHWHRYIEVKLSRDVVLREDPATNKATGEILGKKFALQLSPVFKGEDGLAAVLLTLSVQVSGKAIELDRVYIIVSANIVSNGGETLLYPQDVDNTASIRLLYAILRRVLRAEPWA